jgi:hypothetical protein|tara:strand:+ start:259 stop:483 length:225 start_codon:yes stop_codon:yes gene_type:complete
MSKLEKLKSERDDAQAALNGAVAASLDSEDLALSFASFEDAVRTVYARYVKARDAYTAGLTEAADQARDDLKSL